MTPEEARERCTRTRKEYLPTRHMRDATWTLQMAYNEGQQWGYMTQQSSNIVVKQLKGVLDLHGAQRARITINEIGSRTAKMSSLTAPQQISATIKGPSGITDTYTRTAGQVLKALRTRIGALQHVKDTNKDRNILGCAGIRQVLRTVGGTKTVMPAHGRRAAKELRRYEIDWAPVMPWEIIRSPMSKTVHMARDEETIGHEKPRTVGWMYDHYRFAPKTDTEIGQLAHFLDEIRHAQNHPGEAPLLADAKEHGVLAEEYWLTDARESARIYDETGLRVRWPWVFFGYIDPAKGNGEIQPVSTIGNNGLLRNPFSNMPIYFLHYHVATEAMWPTGMPWQLMQWQDFNNVAWTWIGEVLQQSGPKWVYELQTIDEAKRATILNNDPLQPIGWKRFTAASKAPERIPGAPIPQMAHELVRLSPEGMNRIANIAPVQMGQGYKRDGSGKAYETLIQEAESVPEERITSDELMLGRLLRDTVIDTINMSTLDQLGRLTGGQISESFLKELKRDDARLRIESAEVHPSTMRPKTKQATETRYVGLVREQILPPEQGVKEAILAGLTGLDTDREQAYRLQEAEIERMRAGEQADVLVGDEHVWHIEALRRTLNSPQRLDFSQEFVQALQQHSLMHQIALEQTTGMALGQPENLTGQPETGGMASQPAAQPAGLAAPGPAGPQLQIA